MSIGRRTTFLGVGSALLLASGKAFAQAKSDIKLPQTLVWTAYDVGSSGYAQAVGIGSVLKNAIGTNLRVLPGKNDVSRLAPLRQGTAQFSATGSDNVYGQEAVFTFGEKEWGPQPIRLLLQNFADGSAVALATAADANIKTLQDLKGKRVAWVRGAPALNQAVTCMLAFAGLTWDDVVKVEFGGHGPTVDGIVNNEVDAFNNATFSALNQKIAASPRGIFYPPVPHADTEGWKRLQAVVPWYDKHIATDGVGIRKEGQEMAQVAYPVLVSYDKLDEAAAYNMVKAMHKFYEDYKGSAPGGNGWAMDRQKWSKFVPYHPGAVRYFKEIGVWPKEQDEIQAGSLARQKALIDAWAAYTKGAPSDKEAFKAGWIKARAEALKSKSMVVVFDTW
ncbi:MAG: TAXI family TRAP transporter solute-binding subunit [Alphaproteobacteria bacterium]|nr:TAXI family TRAP transporter solute-binding subunit [Alphaproteobacteria bacterium]MCW5740832.1 TAXI family TRAP transporter solute-binding subunit [Alphaproteobacteria bacterium]